MVTTHRGWVRVLVAKTSSKLTEQQWIDCFEYQTSSRCDNGFS